MFKSWTLPVLLLLALAGAIFFVRAREYAGETEQVASPTPAATQKPSTPSPSLTPGGRVVHSVPFVAQAPTGRWDDPRQQDGCEEAAAYMAWLWATDALPPSGLANQEQEILKVSAWEEEKYGNYHDTSVEDTVERVFRRYFQYDNVKVRYDVSVHAIKEELAAGNLVVVPADGRKLANPNYTAPGPERHNLVIIGYDEATGEFITNDNGTRRGKGYRYKYKVMIEAIRDYPTGDHLPIEENIKVIIVISK